MLRAAKQYIVVANWKMYLDFDESISFCTANQSAIAALAGKHKIIFLPSCIALNVISNTLVDTNAFFGAQNCSEFDYGAYTGEVSAKMLAGLGCSYCLVGHQERRTYFHETDKQIAKKLYQLIQVGITPILCVGEPNDTPYDSKAVKKIVEEQIGVLATVSQDQPLYIAYEPKWAIGKNSDIFDEKQIEHVKKVIQFLASNLNSFGQVKLLYGGSVNQHSVQALLKIQELDGFLMGKASINFAEFQKTVNLL